MSRSPCSFGSPCTSGYGLRRKRENDGLRRKRENVFEHYPPAWKFRVLAGVRGNGRVQNRQLLAAWGIAEGGTARDNPLNTTLRQPGSWNYNSAGVQNYPSAAVGIGATVKTLTNGYYVGIVNDLRSAIPRTPEQIVRRNAHEFDTWGTGADNIL